MTMLYELMAQSRTDEVVRDANHPARLAEHELRLARRRARTIRTTHSRALVRAFRAGLPAATAWLAALVAVVS